MRHVGVLGLKVGEVTILEKKGREKEEEKKKEDADFSPVLLCATTAGFEEAVGISPCSWSRFQLCIMQRMEPLLS